MKCLLNYILLLNLLFFTGTGYSSEKTAAPDSLPLFWMSEIVVFAERLPMLQSTSIYNLNHNDILRLDIHHAADALQFAPGMHSYLMSKNEMTLNLRGFENRQISVFLDGIPISLPYDGQIDLSQLGGDQLNQIRIARGSGSSLYGANSLGGGINLITTAHDRKNNLNIRIEGSSHRQVYTGFGYHNQFGPLKYVFHANYNQANNFLLPATFKDTNNEDGDQRDNSAFNKMSAGIKMDYDLSKRHSVGINANWINNNYNIPPNTKTNSARYWRFPKWRKNIYSINTRHLFSDNFLLRTLFYYDSYYNLLKSYDNADFNTQTQKYAWDSVYDDYSVGFSIYPSFNIFDLGSSNMILSYKKDVHGEKFRNFDFNYYKMSTLSLGFEQDIHFATQHSMIIGADINQLKPLYANGDALRKEIWLLNGQIAYQYELYPNLNFHLSIAKKGRYPTLKELYSERLGRTIPNPNLSSEQALNSELGILHKTEFGYFQLIAYHNQLKNLISSIQLGEDQQQLQNIGRAILKGIELDTKVSLGKVRLMATYSLLSALNVSANRSSGHLPNRPLHQLNLLIDWQIWGAFSAGFENRYVAEQYYENPNSLRWEKFENYYLLNVKFIYQVTDNIKWYFRINNLTDTLYENDFGVPMPGREMISGIKFIL